MAWKINGETIAIPAGRSVDTSSQEVVHRTLAGTFTRDFVGTAKRIVSVQYDAVSADEWAVIFGHYAQQRDFSTTKSLTVDELGLSMNVLIQVQSVNYDVPRYYGYFQAAVKFIEV